MAQMQDTFNRVNDTREFMGYLHPSDTTFTPAPNTYGTKWHRVNTGEQFVWDGEAWVEDMRLVYALSQVITA